MKLDPKLQCLLSDLEMGLKTTIFKSSFDQSKNSVESHLGGNFTFQAANKDKILFFSVAILDIEDEAEYWSVVKKNSNNKEESRASGKICSLFMPVAKQLKYNLSLNRFICAINSINLH